MKVPFAVILCPTDLSEDRATCAVPVAYPPGGRHSDGAPAPRRASPRSSATRCTTSSCDGYVPTPEEREAGERPCSQRHASASRRKEAAARHPHWSTTSSTALSVSDAIEEAGQRLGAEVVVMGTRGRTGLGRLVMGSVATEVVGKESCR